MVEALGTFLIPLSYFPRGDTATDVSLLFMFLAIGYGTLLSMGSVVLEEITLRRYPKLEARAGADGVRRDRKHRVSPDWSPCSARTASCSTSPAASVGKPFSTRASQSRRRGQMRPEWIDNTRSQAIAPSPASVGFSGGYQWRLRLNWKLFLKAMFLVAVVAGSYALAVAADDVVAEARRLAYSGTEHHQEAARLLEQHLAQEPEDSDARVLYGTVLSWQGRYVDARGQLSRVLAERPDDGDALSALINVELWSHHPDRAEQLAGNALSRQPNDIELLLAHATALRDMGRKREALATLHRVLQLSPGNRDAKRLRRTMAESIGKWEANVSQSYDWFSDGRSGLQQTSLSLRAPSSVGPLVATFNQAYQYGLASYQTELEAYPHFGPRTYGHFEFGYSADGNLYPGYRGAVDLYHEAGHGIEVSGGYWRLQFDSGVDIYTFSLAKYYGNWLFTGRGYLTPSDAGTPGTALFSARRFFGSEGRHDYLEVAYSRGASPALATTIGEVQVLDSSRFIVTYDKVLRGKWVMSGTGFIGQEQQAGLPDLKRYSLQGSISYRF